MINKIFNSDDIIITTINAFNENITKDDISCFSFRYKYEELIYKPRDLLLPINYKKLIKLISSFSSLE